ncbi:MAG: ketopantoate reductase family protein [Candidatus Binatia bacterium]
MRVLIAGAGAIGSVVGGFLRRAGLDVSLLGRARHMDAIARRGLAIHGIWGEHVVHGLSVATDPAGLRGPFDVILLPAKAYDTEKTASAVAPLLADDGLMVSLQNGLGNTEILESIVGRHRALGARVIFGVKIPEPGRAVVVVFADPTAIGPLVPGAHPARDAAARHLVEVLDRAGVPAIYTDRLTELLWAKILYNGSLNPVGALLGVHYGALADRAQSRALLNAVIAEVFAVAHAEGVSLPWPAPAAYLEEFYGRLVPSTRDHRSSMLQDIEHGRRTEVDAINGEVVRRGQRHGIATPVNAALTELIHVVESRREPAAKEKLGFA